MKINHILVNMDPTIDQQPALIKAIALAKKFDASIELFLVVHESNLINKWFNHEDSQEKIITHYLKTQQRWLDTYITDVVHEKIPVSSEVRWHKPLYAEIIKKIDECQADLLIKTTHQHPTLNKLLFSPNDWQLLKNCPVPLLLVKENTPDNYNNIMAAVDLKKLVDEPKSLDDIILDTTAMWSESLGATPHVAHAYDPMGQELWQGSGMGAFGYSLPYYDYQMYEKELHESHDKEFASLIADYQFDQNNIHLESGIAHYKLLDIVNDENIDLLVLGVRSHSGFVGNTAEKILDKINCDILAVKPEN